MVRNAHHLPQGKHIRYRGFVIKYDDRRPHNDRWTVLGPGPFNLPTLYFSAWEKRDAARAVDEHHLIQDGASIQVEGYRTY